MNDVYTLIDKACLYSTNGASERLLMMNCLPFIPSHLDALGLPLAIPLALPAVGTPLPLPVPVPPAPLPTRGAGTPPPLPLVAPVVLCGGAGVANLFVAFVLGGLSMKLVSVVKKVSSP